MAYQSFEDLDVWQRGCRLSVAIFQMFEDCKIFTLRDQVQRAGLPIPSNSAMLEGLRRSILAKSRAKQKRARRKRSKLKT
jgi:four helix bundle protein